MAVKVRAPDSIVRKIRKTLFPFIESSNSDVRRVALVYCTAVFVTIIATILLAFFTKAFPHLECAIIFIGTYFVIMFFGYGLNCDTEEAELEFRHSFLHVTNIFFSVFVVLFALFILMDNTDMFVGKWLYNHCPIVLKGIEAFLNFMNELVAEIIEFVTFKESNNP